MSKTFRILSIDGGGIRGIIPAICLKQFEDRFGPLSQVFDLIAGTSTGGILALGLTRQDSSGRPAHTAERLIELYKDHGKTIFRKKKNLFDPLSTVTSPRYDSKGIDAVLLKYFGPDRLRDCLQHTLVTSYDVSGRRPFIFQSWKAKENPIYDFDVKDVCRATSAAPTFFPPHRVDFKGPEEHLTLIDGGVFANNPAMVALAAAKQLAPEDNYLIVSIGTGKNRQSISYEVAKNWGPLQWIGPLVDVMFDGSDDTVDHQLQSFLGSSPVRNYFRFQCQLTAGTEPMDNTDDQNIRSLINLGNQLVKDNSDRLAELEEILKKMPPAKPPEGLAVC